MSPALLVEERDNATDGNQKLTFDELVVSIRQYLLSSKSKSTSNSESVDAGLDSSDVDPAVLKGLMARYESDPRDWAHMAQAIPSKNYSRNLVDSINRRSNLVGHTNTWKINAMLSLPCSSSSFGIPANRRPSTTTPTLTVS